MAETNQNGDQPLTIVIVGASGDLATHKLIPALFGLYCQKLLPPNVHVVGFARSEMGQDEFRKRAEENLTCRYVPGEHCADRMSEFLARCSYVQGRYDSADSALDLFKSMKSLEGAASANRLYYLAVPASVFTEVTTSLSDAGLVHCDPRRAWSRVIIEKPFGHDRESSDTMARDLARIFAERDIYRIDHYLGKEIVQNLMVLRFANLVFDPLWNRDHIASVQVSWKEDEGIGRRAGYFDRYGIIRDVMQNHLMQILALTAIEEPADLGSHEVRNEKVRVLRAIPPLTLDRLVVGQYAAANRKKGYTEEEGVPKDSITPTYAAAVLRVENERWRGVPFLLRGGKGLDGRENVIRIEFRPKARNLFKDLLPELPRNDLIIRIQPDEAIFLRVVNKVPTLKLELTESELDLRYAARFRTEIPAAYERLLLDALHGDKSLFIRNDELAAAWDIWTPALHELEKKRVRPEPYAFGSDGPAAAKELARREGVPWD